MTIEYKESDVHTELWDCTRIYHLEKKMIEVVKGVNVLENMIKILIKSKDCGCNIKKEGTE